MVKGGKGVVVGMPSGGASDRRQAVPHKQQMLCLVDDKQPPMACVVRGQERAQAEQTIYPYMYVYTHDRKKQVWLAPPEHQIVVVHRGSKSIERFVSARAVQITVPSVFGSCPQDVVVEWRQKDSRWTLGLLYVWIK